MYGDVPDSVPVHQSLLREFIRIDMDDKDLVIYFRSEFTCKSLKVEPEFIWCLDKKYLDGVKRLAKQKDALKKLKANTK